MDVGRTQVKSVLHTQEKSHSVLGSRGPVPTSYTNGSRVRVQRRGDAVVVGGGGTSPYWKYQGEKRNGLDFTTLS